MGVRPVIMAHHAKRVLLCSANPIQSAQPVLVPPIVLLELQLLVHPVLQVVQVAPQVQDVSYVLLCFIKVVQHAVHALGQLIVLVQMLLLVYLV